MIFNKLLFVFCFSLICVPLTAQEELSKEKTFEILNKYQQFAQEYGPVVGWIERAKWLKGEGVDVEHFAKSLLNKEEFIDFQIDALYLLAAETYDSNPKGLVDHVISTFNNGKTSLKANVQCLNILAEMSSPSFLQQPEIKQRIIELTDTLLASGGVLDRNYWLRDFKLESIISRPTELLTKEEKEIKKDIELMIEKILYLSTGLYYATNEQKYLDVIQRGFESSDSMLKNKSKSMLTDKRIQDWHSGMYELFAVERGLFNFYNMPLLSEEELERRTRLSLEARNKPPRENNE